MKAVVQRVTRAEVRVDGECVGRIGAGALILLGVMQGDGEAQARRLAAKIARLRFFRDESGGDAGRMNLSALDLARELLVVSQVTLAADGKKGRRPALDRAAPPAEAERLYLAFVSALEELGIACATGSFGALMQVELVGDGPVTFVLDEC